MENQYNNETNRDHEETSPPVSPLSQSLNSTTISLIIFAIFELETPITEFETLELLRNHLVPLSTRFSSIMERNKKGVLRWKKVDVRMEDHLIVPTFPMGLSKESYDANLRKYLSKIGCEKFSDEKPLWEVHLVKYPSLNGACTMIFKFSHALGDGYSFIRVFFKCCQRADKSSAPLTFPRLSLMKTPQQHDGFRVIGLGRKLFGLMRTCMNTSYDLMDTLLRTTFFEDRQSAIRSETSANMKIELFRPFKIHSVTLSLERVKQVKTKLGATVNDVIVGLLSYIIHLYAVRKTKTIDQYGEYGLKMDSINGGTNTSMTVCVMLNMRIFKGFTSIEDMIKADAWGNHTRLLLSPLPTSTDHEDVNPLDFIMKAKHNMDRKKNSMVFYFIESLLKAAMWAKGQKGIDDMLYSSFKNATTTITSVIGPKEQMAIMNHPVSSFYYFVSGVPQSIVFTSVSCMEQLKLVVTMEKSVIDSELFISCMDEAFDNIFRAAIQNQPGSYKLPPGPYGLPIIGNLHKLGDLPHRELQKLSLKYGPIMYMKLGLVPVIVVSSPELAELICKTHDIVFASRPTLQSSQYFGYEQKGLVFKQYGSAWRNIRKLCTLHLLTNAKIESFKSTRENEVKNAVESIRSAADSQRLIDLSLIVESLAEDITHKTIFGSLKNDRFNSKSLIQEAFRLIGAFNVADYIPYVGSLDLQGLVRDMRVTGKLVDEFLEYIIDQHIKDHGIAEQDHNQRDFVDILLSLMNAQETTMDNELKLDRENVKAILLDMIAAMMDTSATTVEWAISELIKNPRIMKLVQQELETMVGIDRQVEETDLVKLEYLEMVLKESMRLHPTGPLLIPRESMDNININGYDIPKQSRVFVNTWAIGRDKKVWSDNAEEFYPERFIEVDVDMRGNDFRLLPFGSGRRGCPGMQMGLTLVRLMLAQLVHCFNWELPNGMLPHKLEMNEKWGLTVPRANHLMAVPSYRLTI